MKSDELSEGYLSHSATARSQFSMQLIPQVDVSLDKLLRMAICRQHRRSSWRSRHPATILLDTFRPSADCEVVANA
jgi:hypothetical protein